MLFLKINTIPNFALLFNNNTYALQKSCENSSEVLVHLYILSRSSCSWAQSSPLQMYLNRFVSSVNRKVERCLHAWSELWTSDRGLARTCKFALCRYVIWMACKRTHNQYEISCRFRYHPRQCL